MCWFLHRHFCDFGYALVTALAQWDRFGSLQTTATGLWGQSCRLQDPAPIPFAPRVTVACRNRFVSVRNLPNALCCCCSTLVKIAYEIAKLDRAILRIALTSFDDLAALFNKRRSAARLSRALWERSGRLWRKPPKISSASKCERRRDRTRHAADAA